MSTSTFVVKNSDPILHSLETDLAKFLKTLTSEINNSLSNTDVLIRSAARINGYANAIMEIVSDFSIATSGLIKEFANASDKELRDIPEELLKMMPLFDKFKNFKLVSTEKKPVTPVKISAPLEIKVPIATTSTPGALAASVSNGKQKEPESVKSAPEPARLTLSLNGREYSVGGFYKKPETAQMHPTNMYIEDDSFVWVAIAGVWRKLLVPSIVAGDFEDSRGSDFFIPHYASTGSTTGSNRLNYYDREDPTATKGESYPFTLREHVDGYIYELAENRHDLNNRRAQNIVGHQIERALDAAGGRILYNLFCIQIAQAAQKRLKVSKRF